MANQREVHMVDTRILTLNSEWLGQASQLQCENNNNTYLNFTYYNAVQVEPAEGTGLPLLSAYKSLMGDESDLESSQSASHQKIVAFADIKRRGSTWGYSKKEIDEFWSKTTCPLFFVSMINIKETGNLLPVLTQIKRTFKNISHLAYLTFDHCDILLFARVDSFQIYADKIFQLDYTYTGLLEDSITLYSFAENITDPISDEIVNAYIQVGVKDYNKALSFYHTLKETCENIDEDLEYGWLLGRNDIYFYKRGASLSWLNKVIRLAFNPSDRACWYRTFKLSILIPPKKIKSKKTLQTTPKKTRSIIRDALRKFITDYRNKCKEINALEDPVWIRWLNDTALLSEALLQNRLTEELGSCLVPQFLDFFEYVDFAVCSNKMTLDHMEDLKESFSVFFHNISTLIDSTNHSNRQFVQVPSFHPVSFEMPPKIMAYYIALGHRFIEVLRDTSDTYGFTISPRFGQGLDVRSLAIAEVTDNREFLSIGIAEKSLYQICHTTKEFAHELSHFVGETCRCRDLRKKLLLCCGLQTLIEDLFTRFPAHLAKRCPSTAIEASSPKLTLDWSETRDCVEKTYALLCKDRAEFGMDTYNSSKVVKSFLEHLPETVQSTYSVLDNIFEFIYGNLLQSNAAGRRYKQFLEELFSITSKQMKQTAIPKSSALSDEELLKDRLRHEFLLMYEYYIYDGCWKATMQFGSSSTKQWTRYGLYCYLFSETYADLQAIRLLNISWSQYEDLLHDVRAEDIDMRKLVILAALVEQQVWSRPKNWMGRLVCVAPEKRPVMFYNHDINISLYHDLKEYLLACSTKMSEAFLNSKSAQRIGNLQKLYDILSQDISAYVLEDTLTRFVADYNNSLYAHDGN